MKIVVALMMLLLAACQSKFEADKVTCHNDTACLTARGWISDGFYNNGTK